MAYATNRYFKPAVYTPIVSEVEAPFKELFVAGKTRQDAKDAKKTTMKTPEGVEILQGGFTPDGEFKPNVHAQELNQMQENIQTGASTISNMIASGNASTQEQQSVMNAVSSQAAQIYGPNGLLKRHADAKKNYEIGAKAINEIPDIQAHPWSALAWTTTVDAYLSGKTDYIDPAAAMKATYIDRNEEINKIISDVKSEGTAGTWLQDGYIYKNSNKEITKEKIDRTFQAGFQNSKLKADMLLEKQYNIYKGMDPLVAEKKFEEQYLAAQTMAEKEIMKDPDISMSYDPLSGSFQKKALEDRLNENKKTVSTKNPKAQGSAWQTRVLDKIVTGTILSNDPQYKSMLSIAKRYFTPDQQKGMSDVAMMKAYNNALKSTLDRSIEYSKWLSPTTQQTRKQNLVNDIENRSVTLIGENGALINISNKKYNANAMAEQFGIRYNTLKDFLEAANVVGIAKTDQHDLGAGSSVATIWSPLLHRQIEFIVSPDMKQEKTYEASTHLNEPLIDPSVKHSYYIVRPDPNKKHVIDFSSGIKVEKGDLPTNETKYGAVPMYLESESYIMNPDSGNEKMGITYRTMVRQSDGTYKEDKNLKYTPESLFNDEDAYYSEEINIPTNQNRAPRDK